VAALAGIGVALFGLGPLGARGEPSTAAPAVMPLVPLTDLAPRAPEVRWRDSKAVGLPHAGRLVRGVQLPAEGRTFFTWDPVWDTTPNRGWRRWGTDKLIRTTLRVARRYSRENPDAPRLTIGDLSRPHGGDFGPQYGSIGHASHQNGLDIDIYYPRRDRRETAPVRPSQVDMRLSQKLVDMFVAAGAQRVFVGPRLALHGPRRVVSPLVYHDNHLHVRLPR
jgi:murein endopeptidase